jgi:hypothetical protein
VGLLPQTATVPGFEIAPRRPPTPCTRISLPDLPRAARKLSTQTLLRDDLFVGYPDRERLLGQVEGMVIGQHVLSEGQTLVDSYQLCGLEMPSALLDEVSKYLMEEASGGEAEARASSAIGEATAGAVRNEPDQLDVLSENVQMSPTDRRAGMLDVGQHMERMLTWHGQKVPKPPTLPKNRPCGPVRSPIVLLICLTGNWCIRYAQPYIYHAQLANS